MFKYLGIVPKLEKALEYMDRLQELGKRVHIEYVPVLGLGWAEWAYLLYEEV